MTRIKEPKIGTTEVPNYKSPLSRIVRSLRKAYDNNRKRLHERSVQILSLREKLRDTHKSREEWKMRAKQAEMELELAKKDHNEIQKPKKKSTKN